MPMPTMRERLVGCWRLVGYRETTEGGEVSLPLGDTPLRTMLYTPDKYMSAQPAKPRPYQDDQQLTAYAIAYSGPFEVDEQASAVARQVQVSVIPSWLGTTQVRQMQVPEPSVLVLSATEWYAQSGVVTTYTITWSTTATTPARVLLLQAQLPCHYSQKAA